jgi:CHAT domain-containing protein
LETSEVWNLPLEEADLVILSACQTQLGDLSAGDELVGLSRAFIYAGAPSLVASLWSVEDESTAYLMKHFYRYLQAGIGKGEALRRAQLDTMEQYPSPYHWAAFTLIGDLGDVTPPPPPRRWLWIGLGTLLVTLVGLGLRVDNHRKFMGKEQEL